MRVALCGLLLAAIVASIAAAETIRRPIYAFDGYAYGIRAQLDAGIPFDRALAHARTIYAPTVAMRPRHAARWLRAPQPQWWHLFAVRVIYPALGSLLWRAFDFQSLFIVSAFAYLASALLTYGMLLRIVRPEIGALIALGIALFPQSRTLERSNLTDMAAYALLVATMWAMMAFTRSGRVRDFILVVAAAAALSFTRPVPYIVVCAALPLFFVQRWRERGLAIAAAGVGLCGIVETVMNVTHADVPVEPHYPLAVARTAFPAVVWWLTHPGGLIGLAALWLRRREPEALIAIGVLLSIPVSILLDPIPSDLSRVVELPALAPLACGFAYVLYALSPGFGATSVARPEAHQARNTTRRDARCSNPAL